MSKLFDWENKGTFNKNFGGSNDRATCGGFS